VKSVIYWSLNDEADTKLKVHETMKQIIPDIKLEEICNDELLYRYIEDRD